MKPEKVLAVTVAQGLVDYFKIFNNPNASNSDITKALSEAILVLSESFGILAMTLDEKEAEGLFEVIKSHSLEFRKNKLKEMKIERSEKGVH